MSRKFWHTLLFSSFVVAGACTKTNDRLALHNDRGAYESIGKNEVIPAQMYRVTNPISPIYDFDGKRGTFIHTRVLRDLEKGTFAVLQQWNVDGRKWGLVIESTRSLIDERLMLVDMQAVTSAPELPAKFYAFPAYRMSTCPKFIADLHGRLLAHGTTSNTIHYRYYVPATPYSLILDTSQSDRYPQISLGSDWCVQERPLDPPTAEDAVSRGNPWSMYIHTAPEALNTARRYLESKNGNLNGQDYEELFNTVRTAYRSDATKVPAPIRGFAKEMLGEDYMRAQEVMAVLGITEGDLRPELVDEGLLIVPKTHDFLASLPVDGRTGLFLGVNGNAAGTNPLEFPHFTLNEQEQPAFDFTALVQPQDYKTTYEYLASLTNELWSLDPVTKKQRTLALLADLAIVSAHLIPFDGTNWGPHYVIHGYLRSRLNLAPRYSWFLDIAMLSLREHEAQLRMYTLWSEEGASPIYEALVQHPEAAVQLLRYYEDFPRFVRSTLYGD